MQEMLEAIGSKLSGNIQYGQMPDEPDNVTTLNFYGGNTPTRSLGKAKPTVREPYFQVRVRNTSYFNCISTIEKHIEVLEAISGEYGRKKITKLTQTGDIIPLGRDSKNRYEFTINFIIQIDNN